MPWMQQQLAWRQNTSWAAKCCNLQSTAYLIVKSSYLNWLQGRVIDGQLSKAAIVVPVEAGV